MNRRTTDKVSTKLNFRARCLTLSLGFMAVVCLGVRAAEKSIKLPDDDAMAQLKPGPNVEVVRNNCSVCHSTDYIVRQPGSHRYEVTSRGLRIALFFTRSYARIVRRGLTELSEPASVADTPLRRAADRFEAALDQYVARAGAA